MQQGFKATLVLPSTARLHTVILQAAMDKVAEIDKKKAAQAARTA